MPNPTRPRPGRVRSGSPTGVQGGSRAKEEPMTREPSAPVPPATPEPDRGSESCSVPRQGAVLPPRQRYHR